MNKKILAIIFSAVLASLNAVGQNAYTLQQLRDSALAGNYSIKSARYSADAAREQRKEVFTKFFPQVSATGLWFNASREMAKTDLNPSEMIPQELGASLSQSLPPEALSALGNPISIAMMKDGIIGSVTAVQPVYAGGQIVNGYRLAKEGEECVDLQTQLSEKQVIKATDEYFWQLVSLEEKTRTLDAVDSLLTKTLNDVEAAVNAGVAVRNDLLQVQLRKNEIASQRVKLQNGISLLKMLLVQHCGLEDSTFTISYTEDYADNQPTADLSQAVTGTTEYQLLEKQVKIAELQKKTETSKNLPSVAIGAGYMYHNLMENDRTFGMVFATVNVPISDWWGGSHAIKRAEINRQKAADQLTENAELLKINIQKAWYGVVESRQQLEIARLSISQSEENLRIVRDSYDAGTLSMSDLLQAQLLYQQSRDKYTESYSQLKISEAEWKLAGGE